MASISMHMVGYIINRGFIETSKGSVRYLGVVGRRYLPIFLTRWISPGCLWHVGILKRGLWQWLYKSSNPGNGLAILIWPSTMIIGANVAAIYGVQLFQADD